MTHIEQNRIYVRVFLDKGDLIHVEDGDDDLHAHTFDGGVNFIKDCEDQDKVVLFYDKTVEWCPVKVVGTQAYYLRPVSLW